MLITKFNYNRTLLYNINSMQEVAGKGGNLTEYNETVRLIAMVVFK